MSENFPTMSGKARFREVYEVRLMEQVTANPARYFYGPDAVPRVAERMVDNLALKTAAVSGEALRLTCKDLGIRFNMTAIADYLRHGGGDDR